jgi:hypothetical protein
MIICIDYTHIVFALLVNRDSSESSGGESALLFTQAVRRAGGEGSVSRDFTTVKK